MDSPVEQSSKGAMVVLVVIIGSVLALAGWLSGFPCN